jgi:hypothetical protein
MSGDRKLHPFNPDWRLAPAATLREWMREQGVSAGLIAATYAPRDDLRRDAALRMVGEVLTRQPLTEDHAAVLARGTPIPARMWLALEHNYRAGLSAGLKDVTPEPDDEGTPDDHD